MKVFTAGATVVSLLTSLATTFIVIWYLGAGRESDLVFAAGTVPGIILQILLGPIGAALTPLLSTCSGEQRRHFEWGLIGLASLCLVPVLLLLWSTAFWWAPLTVPGLSDTTELAGLVRWYVVASLPSVIAMVALPMVQARGRFLAAEISSAVTSMVGLVGTILLLPVIGLTAAPVGVLIRFGLQALFLLVMCSTPVFPHPDRSLLRELWRRHLPLIWGGMLFKTSPFFDRLLCSFLPPGLLTFYQLVIQAFQAFAQVFQRSIVAPFLVELARLFEVGNTSGALSLHRRIARATWWTSSSLYLVGAGLVILMAWSFTIPLIPASVVHELPLVILCFSGLFTAGFLGQLASAWFHACGRTAVPAVVGSVGFIVSTALKAALMPVMGLSGVALGASVGQLGNLLAMERVINSMPPKQTI